MPAVRCNGIRRFQMPEAGRECATIKYARSVSIVNSVLTTSTEVDHALVCASLILISWAGDL
jgi:hypothetical protein